MKNRKNLSIVFLSLLTLSPLRAMPPMFGEEGPGKKLSEKIESRHPGDRIQDATADSSSTLARNISQIGGAVDSTSSSVVVQNQAPSSSASQSWADMKDDLFDGASPLYTLPQVAIPTLHQQIQSIMEKIPQSGVTGCATQQAYNAAKKEGQDCYQIGSIGYTRHAINEVNAENPPIPHEEIEALLRSPNIRVFSETNRTFAIQERDNPGRLIVRIVKYDLKNNVIKLETAFRPDAYRKQALDYVKEAQEILRTVNSSLDLETRWNEIQQMKTAITPEGENVPMNHTTRTRLRGELIAGCGDTIKQLSDTDKERFLILLNGDGNRIKGAFTLSNAADREETSE